jgi:hypothetical protein
VSCLIPGDPSLIVVMPRSTLTLLRPALTGQRTAWPPSIVECLKDENAVQDCSEEAARAEAEAVILTAVKVRPRDPT